MMETASIFLRRSLFLIVIAALPFSLKAQKEGYPGEYKTLFGDDISYGGYGGITMGYTKIGNYDAFTPGVKAAWIIGHTLGLGFQAQGFITELSTGIIPNEEYSFISGGYGGFLIEPIIFGLQPVHVSIPIVLGAGAVVFKSSDNQHIDFNYNTYQLDYNQYFFVLPGVEVELNVTRFFRLALGASYRITSDIDLKTNYAGQDITVLGNNNLNNLVINMSFKFGRF